MTKTKDFVPVPVERITQSISIVRGQRVLLDRDLAAIYGVTTGRFNEAIKRNLSRFPEDFMFQLTREEAEASRSQTAILNGSRGTNIKYLPFAFTDRMCTPYFGVQLRVEPLPSPGCGRRLR